MNIRPFEIGEEKYHPPLSVFHGLPQPVMARLRRIEISNFRAIGATPVSIDLDDIVILVGPNNTGKSSILRAYELVMLDGSSECELTIDDFPNRQVDQDNLPTIELSTAVSSDDLPADKWVDNSAPTNGNIVREKWTWKAPGKPVRVGFLANEGRWATEADKEKVPWGAAAVSNAKRPQPHRIDAFDPPEVQAQAIIGLIDAALDAKIKSLRTSKGEETPYAQLLESVKTIQAKILDESTEFIEDLQTKLAEELKGIFPGYAVKYDPKAEDNIEDSISFFRADSSLFIGPQNGHMSPVEQQGSGAKRTILWAALKMLADEGYKVKKLKTKTKTEQCETGRPHVLLIDEPEICLHPTAVRQACDVLYGLPSTGTWQVMSTSHSPVMIDYTKDNTSIVRVERDETGDVTGSTIFRPAAASLGEDDKENLKLLNMCDPYLSEFFFGGCPVIVEGDTEYAAFSLVAQREPSKYRDVQVIRARGKATIVSLCKILNQFKKTYSILHDSDKKTCTRKSDGKQIANPAWSLNQKIFDTATSEAEDVVVVTSVDTFETAYFERRLSSEKPYSAVQKMRDDSATFDRIQMLFDYLAGLGDQLPNGAIRVSSVDDYDAIGV